jgi:hypothetical protein
VVFQYRTANPRGADTTAATVRYTGSRAARQMKCGCSSLAVPVVWTKSRLCNKRTDTIHESFRYLRVSISERSFTFLFKAMKRPGLRFRYIVL